MLSLAVVVVVVVALKRACTARAEGRRIWACYLVHGT